MLGALVRLVVGQIRSRASLVAENELLRQQLAAAKSGLQGKRVMPTDSKPLEEPIRALATDLIRQRVLLPAGASTQASPSRAGCRPLID